MTTKLQRDPLYYYTIIPYRKDPIQDEAQRQPFLPDELRLQLSIANASMERVGDPDPMVLAHYFLAGGSYDWYVYGGEEAYEAIAQRDDDYLFYGWVIDRDYPQDAEQGEFLLSFLLDLHSQPHGLPVERELIWEPTALSEVKAKRA